MHKIIRCFFLITTLLITETLHAGKSLPNLDDHQTYHDYFISRLFFEKEETFQKSIKKRLRVELATPALPEIAEETGINRPMYESWHLFILYEAPLISEGETSQKLPLLNEAVYSLIDKNSQQDSIKFRPFYQFSTYMITSVNILLKILTPDISSSVHLPKELDSALFPHTDLKRFSAPLFKTELSRIKEMADFCQKELLQLGKQTETGKCPTCQHFSDIILGKITQTWEQCDQPIYKEAAAQLRAEYDVQISEGLNQLNQIVINIQE
ncbi:hypothetical protein CI610_02428 [invertebrate metagenome]|uniref:Uncharacterized protein n=1 Tax=invertebrate metagenome TaxID=1711999 RepID=A0A2H9T609_9ZZZZ